MNPDKNVTEELPKKNFWGRKKKQTEPAGDEEGDKKKKTTPIKKDAVAEIPPEHVVVKHPISYAATLTHLLRGNIGPGIFAMGDAFKNAGMAVAPGSVVVLGLLCLYCQHLLLNVAIYIQGEDEMHYTPDYAKTAELCFDRSTNPKVKRWAVIMRRMINIFLCMTQLGFTCVYFVFISTNLKQVLDQYDLELDLHYLMAIILVPILLTCMVRNLKYIVPLSTAANIAMLVGICITFYFLFVDIPSISSRPLVAHWSKFPLSFGTALYAFEGIALVLPLQREMKNPKRFTTPFGVLNVGLAIVITLFTGLGFFAYLKYGEEITGSVTINLPKDSILAQVVKILIPTGVLLTFALQFYIPISIMWPAITQRFGPFAHPIIGELVFRTVMVLIVFGLAEGIPYLGLFISLVGAINSTALALLFPPILEIVWKLNVSQLSVFTIIKDAFILFIGFLGCITGTYASISEIITVIINKE